MTDPLGRDLNGGTNLAIAGVPVRLSATFTDPGRADTQTASVAWGDGTTDTTFKTFSDARNGATGQPDTYQIVATITDDDLDASAASFTIQGTLSRAGDHGRRRADQRPPLDRDRSQGRGRTPQRAQTS